MAVRSQDHLRPKQQIQQDMKARAVPDFFAEKGQPHAVLAKLPIPIYITTNYDDYMAEALRRNAALRRTTATVVADRIEPVQLQLVCQRLWDRLPAEVDIITSEHVRELGSVDDVLQELFNETIESATEQFGLDPLWLRHWIEEHFVTTLGTRSSIYETPEATEGLPNAVFELLRDHSSFAPTGAPRPCGTS
jgi:hypothetical protein